ncbi:MULTISPECIES: methyltransferase [unclassified Oceanispirochaeta]|uniref:class I SAM-dependent methyltransferase n=1 Tax=unclassified Oceanispirochaeta TaxID=2635722 RepID=UPI000E094357|nr:MULTISPECIES: methyltransferase [unclassified Oceanispirochaeta]MBF9015922.1 class I SAM-dependent methyltransferase [Oceanispirochaeta sp. M2]NPD72385.1 class I SAM-dependent methyltransferase [Oceanispirochaeta sp. M1]RDG32156.1 class I SAM-dependent methyltransferase [Oceanispirochaeta sp. M1]
MNYTYTTPFGNFDLILNTEDKSLRPWDASDEYLLTHIKEMEIQPSKVLIVNDSHGALTVALASCCAAGIQDSSLGIREIKENLELNNKQAPDPAGLLEFKDSEIDLIIVKVPKSLEYFRFQLKLLKSKLKKDCPIIAAGMNKYLPETFFNAVKEFCPDASYSRVVKKARYYEGTMTVGSTEDSTETAEDVQPADSDFFTYRAVNFYSYPGIFSHGKLDGGTRFLLDYLYSAECNSRVISSLNKDSVIVDPGCGYGILGLQALALSEASRVILTDDNALATACTEYNARNLGLLQKCSIIQGNILEGVESGSTDLVVCNPPFHRGHTVSVETGFAFIRDSARVLKKNGLSLFVMNAGLGYGNILNENFESVAVVRENRKFKLILCRR